MQTETRAETPSQPSRSRFHLSSGNEPLVSHDGHPFIAIAAFLLFYLLTIHYATPPDIFSFAATDSQTGLELLSSAPVHASDDVMISLRAGHILLETGKPAYNRQDLAQPSTSYLAPYIFAVLDSRLPYPHNVYAYLALGLLASLLTLYVFVYYSRPAWLGFLVALGFVSTQTHLLFSLNGWDHLIQGFFTTLAIALFLKDTQRRPSLLLIVSILLGLAVAMRPDAALIAVSIIAGMLLGRRQRRSAILFGAIPFAVIITAVLATNLMQFQTLTPTTARLKIGATPSLEYAITYAEQNLLESFTALSVFSLLLIIFLLFVLFSLLLRIRLPRPEAHLIVIAAVATAAFSFFNSDVFPGARMFWTPAAAIAITGLLVTREYARSKLRHATLEYSGVRRPFVFDIAQRPGIRRGAQGIALSILVLIGFVLTFNKARTSLIEGYDPHRTAEAQQFSITQWMNDRLSPDDGSIGLFYLGMAFHLPDFEIADFLGKSDEKIARTEVKWGPPGHNKWDIEATVQKWNPQAIIPAGHSDISREGDYARSLEELDARNFWGFGPALRASETVRTQYDYCYLPHSYASMEDRWGFLLRRDVSPAHLGELTCAGSPVSR